MPALPGVSEPFLVDVDKMTHPQLSTQAYYTQNFDHS